MATESGPVVMCESACTITIKHELSLPPLQLTAEEGAQIASAILAVWAVAWAFKALIYMLKNSDGNQNESES